MIILDLFNYSDLLHNSLI